jgi:hypothetical protein
MPRCALRAYVNALGSGTADGGTCADTRCRPARVTVQHTTHGGFDSGGALRSHGTASLNASNRSMATTYCAARAQATHALAHAATHATPLLQFCAAAAAAGVRHRGERAQVAGPHSAVDAHGGAGGDGALHRPAAAAGPAAARAPPAKVPDPRRRARHRLQLQEQGVSVRARRSRASAAQCRV